MHPDKRKHRYRRHLPHIDSEKPLFITFSTRHRWVLPECVRTRVLEHCIHDHLKKFVGACAIVMPDHVHMIFRLLPDPAGGFFSQSGILKGIKGSSSRSINRMLNRTGVVWEEESFDRVMRDDEDLSEKVDYIAMNPVRWGLVKDWRDYPWFWRGILPGERRLDGES